MSRRYEGIRKHRNPGGWGSCCPREIDQETAQKLLDSAVAADSRERALYNVHEGCVFVARWHRPGRFHGHPVKGSEVPTAVLRALKAMGRIDGKTYRRLLSES